MKMNLKLTADELMNVVDAAMDEAMEQELYFDNFGNDNAEEILAVIDAALSAMGIEVSEEVDEEKEDEDEEEDNDPIADMLYTLDDGRTAISFEDACSLMDMIKEIGIERGLSEDEAIEATKAIFMQIGEDYGIDVVEEEEEEEYTPCDDCYHPYACNMCEYAEPEPESEPETDPIDDMIFDHDGKRSISESDGKLMFDMCFNIIREHNPKMSADQQVEMAQQFFLDVAHGYGIEWVVEDEDE